MSEFPSTATTNALSWNDFFEQQLARQLRQKRRLVRNTPPMQWQKHLGSLLTLLNQARNTPALWPLALDFIETLDPWPRRQGHTDAWESQLRHWLQIAQQQHQDAHATELLARLTDLYTSTGKWEQVCHTAAQALPLAQRHQNLLVYGRVSALLANAQAKLGEIVTSRQTVQNARAELQKMATTHPPREYILANSYLDIRQANDLRISGQLSEALALISNSLQNVLALTPPADTGLIGNIYEARGVFYWANNQFPEALQDLQQARACYESIGHTMGLSSLIANLGLVYIRMARFDEAEQITRSSLKEARQHRSLSNELRHLADLGSVYWLRGQFAEAQPYFQQQLKLAEETQETLQIFLARNNLACLDLYAGHPERALAGLQKAVDDFRSKNWVEALIGALMDLSMCNYALGRVTQAQQLADEAQQLANQNQSRALQMLTLRVAAHVGLLESPFEGLERAYQMAVQLRRPFDQAACLLQQVRHAPTPARRAACWQSGVQLLNEFGAQAWLEGHSIENPPMLAVFI